MQDRLEEMGLKNVYIYSVEGWPGLQDVIPKLKAQGIKNVLLMPMDWGGVHYEWGNHGNENLQPETGHTETLGINYKFDKNTSLSASYFNTVLHDAIAWYTEDYSNWYVNNVALEKKHGESEDCGCAYAQGGSGGDPAAGELSGDYEKKRFPLAGGQGHR